jgi:eukaryotic-like serine/threonine-protein kinase
MPDDLHPNPLPSIDRTRDAEAPSTFDATRSFESTVDRTPPFAGAADAPTIPGYAITGEIARGGMGRVYAAIDHILEREVAIKTLLPGADATRFVTESKITARLPHPGIPPVYALGRLEDGTPYLAMKLIRGRTFAELLKGRASPSDDLSRFIAIFEQIAQAVGFAHEQGIIHRDLKPLNVMVGAFGEVQVMDWGLAKDLAVSREATPSAIADTDDLSHTSAGAIMGTPGYMAPEQARGEPADARADVFALGAILAAILTGKPAFVGTTVRETIEKAARGDLADVLSRVEDCGADAELVALAKRCLAVSPDERAADAQAVAEAVAAYRARVEARLRKAETDAAEAVVREAEQRKRRRVLSISAAVVTVSLVVGLGVSLWQRNVAVEERNKKQIALESEQTALGKEKEATTQALKRLSQVEKGNDILAAVFEDLNIRQVKQGNEPLEAVLANRLAKAGRQLEDEAIGDSLVVAKLQNQLGISLLRLGFAEDAATLFEKSTDTRKTKLGPDHPDTLDSMHNLAVAFRDAGKLDRALSLLEETLKFYQAKLGPDHPNTLSNMGNLAQMLQAAGKLERALPLLEETLKLYQAKLGPDHRDTLAAMGALAEALEAAGKLDLALALDQETLKLRKAKLGPDHPDTLVSMNNLAAKLQAAGKIEQALPLYEETLKLYQNKLGRDHPHTFISMNNLAAGLRAAGKLDRALLLYEENLKLTRAKLGPDHPNTLLGMNNLAEGFRAVRKLDQALPLLEETLKLRKSKLGPDHPDTFVSMNNLALGFQAADKIDRALPLFEEASTAIAKRHFEHQYAGLIVPNTASAYEAAKQLDKAEAWRRQWLAVVKERAGPTSAAYAGELAALGDNLLQQRKYAEAEGVLRECSTIREKTQPQAWNSFNTRSALGAALLGQKKFADAEPLLLKGYEGMKAREKTIPPQGATRIPEAIDRLIELYTATNKPDEVKKWKAERAKYPAEQKQAAVKK